MSMLFSYVMTWRDGTTESGLIFGQDERDAMDAVTYGIREHITRCDVTDQMEVAYWPTPADCPMGG